MPGLRTQGSFGTSLVVVTWLLKPSCLHARKEEGRRNRKVVFFYGEKQ